MVEAVDQDLQRLQGLASAGLVLEAEDALYEMIDKGVEPGVEHYNAMINACVPESDFERADRWLFRMQALEMTPQLGTFNAMMRVAAEAAQSKVAQRWMEEAEKAGFQPDLESYHAMLHALRREGNTIGAEVVFERMMEAGLRPDIACCHEMIAAFAEKGNTNKAEEWLAITERNLGIPLDVEAYNLAAGGYAAAGDLDNAQRLVQLLVENGLSPDAKTYRTIIGDGTSYREFDVVKHWSKELEASGLELDAVTYETLIGAWAAVGDAQAAETWFSKMVDAGLQTSTALAILADALVLSGGVAGMETAQEWVDQSLGVGMELTPAVYAALASADVFRGDFEQVEARMQQMEADGLEMDEDSLASLLLAYANAEPQQSQLAEQMFKQQMFRGKMRATMRVLEALRAAVGGARCLALRRELKQSRDLEEEIGQRNNIKGDAPAKGWLKWRKSWSSLRDKSRPEVVPQLSWE